MFSVDLSVRLRNGGCFYSLWSSTFLSPEMISGKLFSLAVPCAGMFFPVIAACQHSCLSYACETHEQEQLLCCCSAPFTGNKPPTGTYTGTCRLCINSFPPLPPSLLKALVAQMSQKQILKDGWPFPCRVAVPAMFSQAACSWTSHTSDLTGHLHPGEQARSLRQDSG